MAPTPTHADRTKAEHPHACSVLAAVNEIGTEWRLIILHILQDGEKRFNELEQETGGSSSTLSRVLKELEDAGVVNRRVEDRPLATYYSLSESGRQLAPVFDELARWADNNLEVSPKLD